MKSDFIDEFKGKYYYLSNYFSCEIDYEGIIYKSAEAAFQAQKAAPEDRHKFSNLSSNNAKSLGRRVNIPDNWDDIKDDIMKKIVYAKFNQNEKLRIKLHSQTNKDAIFIEGNTWHDNYWGDCKCDKCAKIPGKNKLGNIISDYRKYID